LQDVWEGPHEYGMPQLQGPGDYRYASMRDRLLKSNCKSQLCSLFTSGLALGSPGCSFVRSFVCRSSPCPKYLINPYNAIFLKSQGSKDIKNDILDCQIHKYTNTNTQIHKYTNTACDKMTDIPNICYIFEQLVVQGCQKRYSGLSNTQIHKYKYANTQIHKYSI